MYDGRGSNPQDASIRQILSLLCTPFHHRRMFHVKQKTILSISDWMARCLTIYLYEYKYF